MGHEPGTTPYLEVSADNQGKDGKHRLTIKVDNTTDDPKTVFVQLDVN